jgi:hypothetical protein
VGHSAIVQAFSDSRPSGALEWISQELAAAQRQMPPSTFTYSFHVTANGAQRDSESIASTPLEKGSPKWETASARSSTCTAGRPDLRAVVKDIGMHSARSAGIAGGSPSSIAKSCDS